MEKIKNKSGYSYREKVYINGKPKLSPCFKKKTDAKKWKREQLLERDRLRALGINYIPDIRLNDFKNIFLNGKKSLSPRTFKWYQDIIETHLLEHYGNKFLKNIKLQDAEELKANLLKNNKLSLSRINGILNCFKIIMNEAVRLEYLLRNPLKNLKFIPIQKKEHNYLMGYEIQRFLFHVKDSEYYPLYLTLFNLGLRKAEAFGLEWDCINFDEKLLHVRQIMTRSGIEHYTKGKKIRYLPMNDLMLNEFKKLYSKKKFSNLVFTKKNGDAISFSHFRDRVFHKDLEECGLKKIRLQDTRVSFACNFVMNGGDIFALSKWLGHSSVTITENNYAHLSSTYMAEQKNIVSFSSEQKPLKILNL